MDDQSEWAACPVPAPALATHQPGDLHQHKPGTPGNWLQPAPAAACSAVSWPRSPAVCPAPATGLPPPADLQLCTVPMLWLPRRGYSIEHGAERMLTRPCLLTCNFTARLSARCRTHASECPCQRPPAGLIQTAAHPVPAQLATRLTVVVGQLLDQYCRHKASVGLDPLNPRIKSELLGRAGRSTCADATRGRTESTHCTAIRPTLVPRVVPRHPRLGPQDPSR